MSTNVQSSTIRRRLIRLILLTTMLVVGLTCVAFFSVEVVNFRHAMLRHHGTVAAVVAANATAALAFENPADAEEVLGAFKADPSIEFAALLRADGSVLARYPRRSTAAVPSADPGEGVFFSGARVIARIPVVASGDMRLGTLYLTANMGELRQRLALYAVVILFIAGGALGLAYLIGQQLQRRISEPVLELARAATAVSSRDDYSLRVATVGDGELGQLTTAFNDMLTRIEAQNRSLAASVARHRMLFENSPLPMWVYDLETRRFLAANQAATHVYGYATEEFLGMTIDDIRLDGNAAAPARLSPPEQPVYHGAEIWTQLRKDGRAILVEITAHDLPFDGRPSRLVLANDVTARVAAEQEIRRLNQELEHRVQQRTAQLEQANRELESFSYSVSHDLRAPLRHVQGYVSMLQRAVEGQLPERAQRYLKTINDASVEMGQLIDDLLDFSRMGRVEMRDTVVALDGVLRECLPQLEAPADGRQIDWQIAPLPTVRGDPAMLRQLLVNLLSNAVKYTRQRNPARIEVGTAGEENGRVICYVRDNGAGFDMQYAHKLFGVFQRLHRADEFEGTGIGLATVRRIVTRHGGRVWAEGAVNQGAAFFFTLAPASPPAPPTTNPT